LGISVSPPEQGSVSKLPVDSSSGIYKNRELALAEVADYIDTFYNRTRRHSHLGGVSPEEFEAAHKPRRKGVH
jgi:transposase InsO family protein